MSSPINAATPGSFQSAQCSFTVTQGTAAKVLVDAFPAAAQGALTPPYVGGCSVIDIIAASSDAAAKDANLLVGTVLTTQGTTPTGAMATTTSTITRANGSFIADGWQVGDQVMVFAPFGTAPNAAVDGVAAIITTVPALTLTVNGTPLAALSLAAGSRIVRMTQAFRATVAANSGTAAATAAVGFIGNGNDGSVMKYERKLGAAELLAVSLASAVSALPAQIGFTAQVARY